MFGTGLTRSLTGAAAEAARAVNGSSAPVLALDIPSGLDANTGCVHGVTCVRAYLTSTFGFAKTGQTIVNVPSRAPPGYVPPPVATVAPPVKIDANVAPKFPPEKIK